MSDEKKPPQIIVEVVLEAGELERLRRVFAAHPPITLADLGLERES